MHFAQGTKMQTTIEDASIKMLDELFEIEKQSFEEEAFSKQQIGYLLTDYNAISLVARVDGKIAGFIISEIELVRNLRVGHIMTVDVAVAFRRKGIATRLMLESENILTDRGVSEIRLEVREANEAAIRLYEKLGYKRVSKLDNYYGKEHGLYFRKEF